MTRNRGDRVKAIVEYFEEGCICLNSRKLKRPPSSWSIAKRAAYYEHNCVCSRNYTRQEGE